LSLENSKKIADSKEPIVMNGYALNDSHYVRLGYSFVLVGLGGFLAWAAFAPLDQGIAGQGVVTVINQRVMVQHPIGGVLDAVLIKEGDKIKAGQVIAKLNSTDSSAQTGALNAQYRAVKSEMARLLAELSGKKILQVQEPLAADVDTGDYQAALLLSRRAALTSELALLHESLRGLQSRADSFKALTKTRQEQKVLMQQQLSAITELTNAGYYPKNRMLELENQSAERNAKANETVAELNHIESSITELKYKIVLRKQDYKKEIELRLTELKPQLLGLKNKLAAAEFVEASNVIYSPKDGISIGLKFHTKGEVIPAGGHIVDIVPDHELLIIEAKFSPDTIQDLIVGLAVDVRFPGFQDVNLPVVEGKVLTISADNMVDEANHARYFLARIEITSKGLITLNKFGINLQPGIPAEVLVKTGERTMLSYLISPIQERVEWALIQK
jgi:membrane fusion protein, protease secretion system